jgi:hypothetical protein
LCYTLSLCSQAGHWDSEGQQRLVSLTAQVTSQAAQLAAAEQRCKDLLVSDGVVSQWHIELHCALKPVNPSARQQVTVWSCQSSAEHTRSKSKLSHTHPTFHACCDHPGVFLAYTSQCKPDISTISCYCDMQADADSRASTIARLRQQLDAAQQEAAGRAAAAAAAEGANAGLSRQLGELREQLKAAAQQVRAMCEPCD